MRRSAGAALLLVLLSVAAVVIAAPLALLSARHGPHWVLFKAVGAVALVAGSISLWAKVEASWVRILVVVLPETTPECLAVVLAVCLTKDQMGAVILGHNCKAA